MSSSSKKNSVNLNRADSRIAFILS
jgi:hypothetical protein